MLDKSIFTVLTQALFFNSDKVNCDFIICPEIFGESWRLNLKSRSDMSHQLVKSQRNFSLFLKGPVQLELRWSSLCNKLPWHLTFEWNFVFLDSIHIKWFKKLTPFLRHKAHTHPGGSYKACQVVFNSFVSQPPYTIFVTGQLIQIWYYLQPQVWAGVSVCIHYP